MTHTTKAVRIRDAHPNEQAVIRDLTLAAYAEYATRMTPSAWAALEQALLTALSSAEAAERIVAEQAGKLVGSVLLYPPAANAYDGTVAHVRWPEVRLLAVAPAARRQGVGTTLMDECVRRARRFGAPGLGLHTSDSMQIAIQMYERMGFVRAPDYDFQASGSEVVKAYHRSLAVGPDADNQ